MAISLPLTSSWWTASDWLNPDAPTFSLAGTGTVEYAWSVGMPPSTFYGAPLISPNAYGMPSPIAGAKLYLRITSGSVTIYYDKKDGPSFSLTLSGNAFTGGAGSDTGWVQTPTPTAGFDNITPRAAANPYEFNVYMGNRKACKSCVLPITKGSIEYLEIEDVTYNFTLQELLDVFLPVIPANNLQGILDRAMNIFIDCGTHLFQVYFSKSSIGNQDN